MLPGWGDRSSAPLSLEGMLGIWAHLARILGIGLGMDPPAQGYVPAYPGLGSGFKPNSLVGQKGVGDGMFVVRTRYDLEGARFFTPTRLLCSFSHVVLVM